MIQRLILVIAVLALPFTGLSCTSVQKLKKLGTVKIVDPPEAILKEHAEEIDRLYGKLKIVSLDEIPESKYADYRHYAFNGSASVIVHPSYYLFFHDNNEKKIVVERKGGDFSKNIVDIFVEDYPAGDSKMLKQMKASAKRERDFIRKNSLYGRLVILVLPLEYRSHPEYPYGRLDEFARYLNEVSGGSSSVIYIESDSYKRGHLSSDVLTRLNKFLNAVGVNTLLLGGGYKNLCLGDFYDEMKRVQDIESVEIVPEICTESPDFISEDK